MDQDAPIARRWDTDEVGHGIASGRKLLPELDRLREALDLPDWIAEQPEDHLLPHLQRVLAAPDSPLELVYWAVVDGALVLDVRQRDPTARPREDREAVLGLVGAVAETATWIRQRRSANGLEFDVATGVLAGDALFASHGHLLRIRIAA